MVIKEEDKDLNYWKSNAEEDYMTVPISVLRYISELEKEPNEWKSKLKNFMTGLECQRVDLFLSTAQEGDYLEFGKAFQKAIKKLKFKND